MKFLVIKKLRAGIRMTPTAQMIREHEEIVLRDADCAYAFVGGGGFSIQNANSAEDLNQRLMSSPVGLFYEFDLRALTDYSKFMNIAQMVTLLDTFVSQVAVFNNTFTHDPIAIPYTAADLNNIKQFYDSSVIVITPTNRQEKGPDEVVNDFAKTAPLKFDNFSGLRADDNSGLVTGWGEYSDNDNGRRPIRFQFNYVLTAGGWLVRQVIAWNFFP
jgi:hypothetical protein